MYTFCIDSVYISVCSLYTFLYAFCIHFCMLSVCFLYAFCMFSVYIFVCFLYVFCMFSVCFLYTFLYAFCMLSVYISLCFLYTLLYKSCIFVILQLKYTADIHEGIQSCILFCFRMYAQGVTLVARGRGVWHRHGQTARPRAERQRLCDAG